jgi:small subunit ribosomal protein S4
MARYIGPVCKLCRRENLKIFLKGDRCYSDKCAFDRRPYPPGQHGQGRIKFSEYAVRLREKQKVRRMYGIFERQFRLYFQFADQAKGVTGENLLRFLERRLDNVVYRIGFASTRSEARQLVRHNHVLVNGKRVNIPSYLTRANQTVSIRERSKKIARIAESMEAVERRGPVSWLELDKANFQGVVKQLPARDDITMPIQEQMIVEFYSR